MVKRSEMTQEQKQEQNKYNAKYREKYNAANYDKITLRVRKDGGQGVCLDEIKTAAQKDGKQVNTWILELIKNRINEQ